MLEPRLVECFVTHVEREGPLLKVWAQLDRKVPTYIEKTILELAPDFDGPVFKINNPSALRIHQLCCAKYSDGSYYRARVTSLANISAGEVAVQFADYGNHEVIPLDNMRILDIGLGPVAKLPDQASDFYLGGVYPASGEWSLEMLGHIREAICYSDLGFLLVGELGLPHNPDIKKSLIQLMYEHQDFAAILVAKKMGIAILVDTQKQLLGAMLEKKPLPPLTLWPPYNPAEPPPGSQMMVPLSLATAAQMAVAETHEKRLAQQMPLQPQAHNQGFGSSPRPSAQQRLLPQKAGYADTAYMAPVQFQQAAEPNYQSNNAQLRLDQVRQQRQQESINQNRIEVAQMQPVQRTYDHSTAALNNARMRWQQPVDQPYTSGSQIHQLPIEQRYTGPPPMLTSRSTPPARQSAEPVDHVGFLNSKEVGALNSKEVGAAHVFQSNVLELNTDHEIFVSFAEDGPNGFAVQLSSLEDKLGKLLDEINRDEPAPLTQLLMPGSTCLGRYTIDQTLCRAVVMSVHSDTCHVYYVDFGNSEELPFSEIFDLPQSYVVDPQVMAIRMTLSGLGTMVITKQVKEVFCALVNNRQFLLRVVPPEGPPLRQYGILYDEGRNILDILKEKLKSQQVLYSPIALPEAGSREIVTVAYVESLGNFFVQRQDNLMALESVMEELATHCETAVQLSQQEITEGLPCCSLYSGDELWYRAQVKKVTDKGIIVDYVDYGNTEPVQLDSLRKISPALITVMQAQAIACCLNKLQNVEASDELMEKFAVLTDDKSLTMEVLSRLSDGRLVVELHDMTGTMAINIGAAMRAPKQPVQQKIPEQPRPTPTKIVSQPLPVCDDERQDSKQSADTFKAYEKTSRDTRNEDKPNQFRSNVEDWRKKDGPEERPNHFDSNRGKDRDTKDRFQARGSETEDRYGGNKEERGGGRWGGDKEERGDKQYGSDRDENKGNRFGGDRDENKANRFGGDRDENSGNRFGGDREDNKGNRFGGDKEERSNNRFGGDKEDKKGRYGDKDSQQDQGNNRFGGDRGDKRESRFGADKEDRGGYRGGERRERYPSDKGDAWGSNDKKSDAWGGPSVVESVQIFATPDQRFSNEVIEQNLTTDVVVIWFINPQHFFVQMKSKQRDLETTMKDIQSAYCGKPANVKDVVVGSPVIAKYVQDKVLYRAEVTEVKDYSYVVRYVDYGNLEVVKKSDLWQIETRFLDMPKQAIVCALDVTPIETEWPKDEERIDKLFQNELYQCTFHEPEDDKNFVTLKHGDASVGELLQAQGLARTQGTDDGKISKEEPIKKELYRGQTLMGHITYVEGVASFFAHFNVNEANRVQALVDEYVQNLEAITPLPADQICVGKLCIATADSTQWYRAKVVEPAETEGVYYITFFDYGDGDEVAVDKMIELPEHLGLSVLVAQATEMFLTGSDETEVEPETEDLFKANLEGLDAVIHVDSVSVERLNVTVFSLDGQKLELVKHIGNESQVVQPVLPLPMLAQKVSVFISHVDSPTSLWLQTAKNFDLLTALVDSMYLFYEEHGQGKELEPKENSLCAAKSLIDEGWYRAKIVSISEEGVKVLFLDYGNSEVIPTENVKALDASLHMPHAQAINVSLPVVIKTELKPNVIEPMAVEFVAVFHLDERGIWYSELVDKKETLSDILVEEGYVELMENYPFASYVEELTTLPKLVTGMQASIYVSHVDSPGCFWIQREENSSNIEDLQAVLQDLVETLEVLSEPVCDAICTALYAEDGLWYRATILEVNDSGVKVRFIDYGNTDLVDITTNPLKVLPPKYVKLNAYAVQCGLNVLPIDTEFSAEATQSLEALVAETESPLLAVVVAERDCAIIDIFLGDKSFAASLIADDLVVEFVEENSVYISHANSPSEFWIQPERSTKRLEIMTDRMAVAAEFEPLPEVTEGCLCAAQFVDDEQWYRARVVASSEEGTEVEFIDFGNSSMATELRMLPEDLATSLPLAKRCSLPLSDGQTEWSDEANEKFLELIAEGSALFSIEFLIDEESPAVVQLTYSGKNIRNMLSSEESDIGAEEEDGNFQETLERLPEMKTPEEKEEQFHDTVENLPISSEENLPEPCALVEEPVKETTDPDLTIESDNTLESNQDSLVPVDEPVKGTTDLELTIESDNTLESNQDSLIPVDEPVKETTDSELTIESDNTLESNQDSLVPIDEPVNETIDTELTIESDNTLESNQDSLVPVDEPVKGTIDSELTIESDNTLESNQDSLVPIDEPVKGTTDPDLTIESDKTIESNQEEAMETTDLVELEEGPMTHEEQESEDKSNKEASFLLTKETLQLDDTVEYTGDELDVAIQYTVDETVTSGIADIKQQLPDLVCPAGEESHTIDEFPRSVSRSSSRSMTPRSNTEKIVPGSIGGGVSLEELHSCLESPRPSSRNMSDKIVPGCVSRGVSDEELQKILESQHSDNLVPEEVVQSCPATPIPSSYCPSPLKVKHSERIVPGCISSGVSTEDIVSFEKPKHGERVVPGSISRGVSLEEMEDSDIVISQNDLGKVVNGVSGTGSV